MPLALLIGPIQEPRCRGDRRRRPIVAAQADVEGDEIARCRPPKRSVDAARVARLGAVGIAGLEHSRLYLKQATCRVSWNDRLVDRTEWGRALAHDWPPLRRGVCPQRAGCPAGRPGVAAPAVNFAEEDGVGKTVGRDLGKLAGSLDTGRVTRCIGIAEHQSVRCVAAPSECVGTAVCRQAQAELNAGIGRAYVNGDRFRGLPAAIKTPAVANGRQVCVHWLLIDIGKQEREVCPRIAVVDRRPPA